jgi:hypothetical protein
MKIHQAMELVSNEYDQECLRARQDAAFNTLMSEAMDAEYDEIDQELPGYVAEIARAHGVPAGTMLPPYVYQLARMVFRMGMRTQRKIDRPEETSTMFWRSDQKAV